MSDNLKLNSFNQQAVVGMIAPIGPAEVNTIDCVVSPNATTNIVVGDPVKLVDLGDGKNKGKPMIDKITDVTAYNGVVIYNIMKNTYAKNEQISIALQGTFLTLRASEVITAGSSVVFDLTKSGYVKNATDDNINGIAWDRASKVDDIITIQLV